MPWIKSLLWLCVATATAQSTEGLYSLVKRRLPNHVDHFRFILDTNFGDNDDYDQFVVQSARDDTIECMVTPSVHSHRGMHGKPLLNCYVDPNHFDGLRRYLTDVAHVDIYWFLALIDRSMGPARSPGDIISILVSRVFFAYQSGPLTGSVTFSYTTPRTTVYNNTNFTTDAVSKPILLVGPQFVGIVGVTGSFGTALAYDPMVLVQAWQSMSDAAKSEPKLWSNLAYQHDMVDSRVMG